MSRFRRPYAATLLTALALTAAAGSVSAAAPANLSDIAYQSTEWGAEQLRLRGYTLMSSDYHHGMSYEYWWQGSSNTCIKAVAAGSKYDSLDTTSSTDCKQYQSSATRNDQAAAIAIGAAAIIGAAVLAHQSHQRDEKHGQDSKSVAEFDRGYRDGLYDEAYHNYNNTTAYSDGFSAGHQQHEEETTHRSHRSYSGYQSYVPVNDLVGARASSADTDLRSRGFTTTGGYQQDGRAFATWYNARTHQCLQVVTQGGRIASVDDISEGICR